MLYPTNIASNQTAWVLKRWIMTENFNNNGPMPAYYKFHNQR